MKIINEPLLNEFRRKTRCEWCGKKVLTGLDPHHYLARGMGGGGRLDVRLNLVSLCRVCHNDTHAGVIMRCDLLAVIAAREGVMQDAIMEELWRLRRTPKEKRV